MDALDGCFINLDRSEARRLSLEARLRQLGMDWVARLPAVDGHALERPPSAAGLSPGQWGCLQSHRRTIESAHPDSFTLVLEDDVDVSEHLPTTLTPSQVRLLQDFDVVMLDFLPEHPSFDTLYRRAKNAMNIGEIDMLQPVQMRGAAIQDLRGIYSACAAGYVVTPAGKRTLRARFAQIDESGEPQLPVDTLFLHEISDGRLRAAALVPFLVSPSLAFASQSTIGYLPKSEPMARWCALADAYRRLLYAGPAGPEVLALISPYVEVPVSASRDDITRTVLLALYEFLLDR